MSKSSRLSIFEPLILEIQFMNGTLCLNATALFLFALFGLVSNDNIFFHDDIRIAKIT